MAVDSGSFSALVTTATSATATATSATATAKSTRSPATATPRLEPEHHRHQQYDHKPRWNMHQQEEQKSVKPNGQQTTRENHEKGFDNPRY